jgi:hypothetical protein
MLNKANHKTAAGANSKADLGITGFMAASKRGPLIRRDVVSQHFDDSKNAFVLFD